MLYGKNPVFEIVHEESVRVYHELGRNPVSKHQIQPEYGDEQADAGRDG